MSECISYRDVAPKVTEKCVRYRYSRRFAKFQPPNFVTGYWTAEWDLSNVSHLSFFLHPRYYCLFTLTFYRTFHRSSASVFVYLRRPRGRERERERERNETPRCKCLLYEIKEHRLNKFGRISLISVLLVFARSAPDNGVLRDYYVWSDVCLFKSAHSKENSLFRLLEYFFYREVWATDFLALISFNW